MMQERLALEKSNFQCFFGSGSGGRIRSLLRPEHGFATVRCGGRAIVEDSRITLVLNFVCPSRLESTSDGKRNQEVAQRRCVEHARVKNGNERRSLAHSSPISWERATIS